VLAWVSNGSLPTRAVSYSRRCSVRSTAVGMALFLMTSAISVAVRWQLEALREA